MFGKKITAFILTLILVFALAGSALALDCKVDFTIAPEGGGTIHVALIVDSESSGTQIDVTQSTAGYTFGGPCTMTMKALPNPGYVFDHWEVVQENSEPALMAAPDPYDDDYSVWLNGDMAVTAYFRPIETTPPPANDSYTVSYHPNGGTGTVPIDMNRYYRGDPVHLASGAGLSKAGCVFMGWAFTDGTAAGDPFAMPDRDITLFAVWKAGTVPVVPKTGGGYTSLGPALILAGLAAAAFALVKKRALTK